MTTPMFDYETPGYRRIKETSLRYVHGMKLGDQPGRYRKEPGGGYNRLTFVPQKGQSVLQPHSTIQQQARNHE